MKNCIHQALIAGIVTLLFAINIGILVKEWMTLPSPAETYSGESAVNGMLVMTLCIVAACAFLYVCTWLILDEAEKYGYWK